MLNMHIGKAGGNGLATPVSAGPVFLKVKKNFHFYKKQVYMLLWFSELLGLLY